MDPFYPILILFAVAIAMGIGWCGDRRYMASLERENVRIKDDKKKLSDDNATLRGENRRLKRELESDASGQVDRDPKTGRFIKEQSH